MKMISNTKQNWIVGHAVKVGFMTLNVRAVIKTPGDYLPDAYILSNLRGDKLYKFVPHNGCQAITVDEAKELMDEQREIDASEVESENARMMAIAAVNAVFA
jgi:hypothetical protein